MATYPGLITTSGHRCDKEKSPCRGSLGLVHGLKAVGVPFGITRDYQRVLQHMDVSRLSVRAKPLQRACHVVLAQTACVATVRSRL
jgi:hypothetical protein